jgi:hypothetical protein
MPKHELLECASLIASAYENPIKQHAFLSEGRTPLCELPVNQVIKQWPWELVTENYSTRSGIDKYAEDSYFGHISSDFQWQQLITA